MPGLPEIILIITLLAALLAVFTVAYILASGSRTERKLPWIAAAVLLPIAGPIWYFKKGRTPARPDPEHP